MKRFLTGFLSIVILLGAIVAGAEVRVMANVDGDVMAIGGKVIIVISQSKAVKKAIFQPN